jgi:hypothetical protein
MERKRYGRHSSRNYQQKTLIKKKNKVAVIVEYPKETKNLKNLKRYRQHSDDLAGEYVVFFKGSDIKYSSKEIKGYKHHNEKIKHDNNFSIKLSTYKFNSEDANNYIKSVIQRDYSDKTLVGPIYPVKRYGELKLSDAQHIVSGTIEGYENAKEAAEREVREEIGLMCEETTHLKTFRKVKEFLRNGNKTKIMEVVYIYKTKVRKLSQEEINNTK